MIFQNKNEYIPSSVYPDLDFSKVKYKLIEFAKDYIDYGSLFLMKNDRVNITINKNGKIVVFYNEEDEFEDILSNIENTFKCQVSEFRYCQV